MQKVIHGNNIDVLKSFPDNHFDAVVTDPPYGLGKEPDAAEVMQAWVSCGYHEIKGSGFMGKEWDAFVPQPLFWKEVYRVLKHGGHVLSFFGTRTYDWGVMAMRFAGFEIRDCIQWLYGSGFPKSHNISKAIDKLHGAEREMIGTRKHPTLKDTSKLEESANAAHGQNKWGREWPITSNSTDDAKNWEGWGSALKPANEPIVLARKPLEKGLSIAENVLKYGTGGINIDGCRVVLSKGDDSRLGGNGTWKTDKAAENIYEGGYKGEDIASSPLGRFPANIILTHHPECECKGVKKIKGIVGGTNPIGGNYKLAENKTNQPYFNYADENGQETIEDWNCHPDCPIKIMDEQSGVSKTGDINPYKNKSEGTIYGNGKGYYIETKTNYFKGDEGGASRFFYCAKASKSERNKGLDGFEEKPLAFSNQAKAELKRGNTTFDGGDAKGHGNSIRQLKNFHPTVKPVKLMQYLVRLITPPNGIVLDPFVGSGTTGIAAKLEGFSFVGIEQDPEYCKIAEARIQYFVEDIEGEKENTDNSTSDKDENSNLEGFQQLSLF